MFIPDGGIKSQQIAPSFDALEHAIEKVWITVAILGVDGLLCLLWLCLGFLICLDPLCLDVTGMEIFNTSLPSHACQ
jgi:hypothetical protein